VVVLEVEVVVEEGAEEMEVEEGVEEMEVEEGEGEEETIHHLSRLAHIIKNMLITCWGVVGNQGDLHLEEIRKNEEM
jgi:hypothetical protein